MKYKNFREICEKVFEPSEVEVRAGNISRDGKSALALLYIKADSVRKRLDEACEAIDAIWSYDCTYEVHDNVVVARATISVSYDDKTIVRTAIGQEFIQTESDLSKRDGSRGEAFKSAETDAFKRVGARFGIGGYLQRSIKLFEKINEYRRFERDEIEIIKDIYAKSNFNVQYANRHDVSRFISEVVNANISSKEKDDVLKWLSLRLTTLERDDLRKASEKLNQKMIKSKLLTLTEQT